MFNLSKYLILIGEIDRWVTCMYVFIRDSLILDLKGFAVFLDFSFCTIQIRSIFNSKWCIVPQLGSVSAETLTSCFRFGIIFPDFYRAGSDVSTMVFSTLDVGLKLDWE